MKKLIAISVVFALVAGVAFAVDLGGSVVATFGMSGDNGSGSKVQLGGNFDGITVQGSGEVADGKFGGWVRIKAFDSGLTDGDFSGKSWETAWLRLYQAHGIVWWKPIDQFKLNFGGNPDGIWAKEGGTAWMFYQSTSDTKVVNVGNAWGGGYSGQHFRQAVFGGFADPRLYMDISPIDMVDIHVGIPFWHSVDASNKHDATPPTVTNGWGKPYTLNQNASDVIKLIVAQLDFKLNFGNIALTYDGGDGDGNGKLFAFFSLSAIDNLNLDFGLGVPLPKDGSKPLISMALFGKYSMGAFGVKLRTLFNIDTSPAKEFGMVLDVLPFYAINDNIRAFLSAGIAMTKAGDTELGWHINPYLEVGEEWGAKFVGGFRIQQTGIVSGSSAKLEWFVPIAAMVSF